MDVSLLGNNDKKIYLNRLRVLASLFVVFIHTTKIFYGPVTNSALWIISATYNSLARTAVPLFIFISGAIYLNEDRFFSFRKILMTILRFVVMFFIWDLLYLAVDKFIVSGATFNLSSIAEFFKSIAQYYKYHLWYLIDYIFLLAMVPVLRLICKRENKKIVKYLLLIFILTYSVLAMLTDVIGLFEPTNFVVRGLRYVFSIIDLVNFRELGSLIILFMSGWYFSTFDFSDKKKLICWCKWLVGILSPAVAVALSVATGTSFLSIVTTYYYLPNYILTVCIFLTFRYSKIANTDNKFWDFISKNTLGIYLVHVLVLELLLKLHFIWFGNTILSIVFIPIYVLIIYLASLGFSVLVGFLPKKIKKWIM